ncbi:MAG: hypothetical protein V1703_03740 [Candidatus Altiarchaeota archaeon]
MEFQNIVIGTLMMIILVLVPGFALSLAIFPKKDELDLTERLGFSFVFGLFPQLLQYFLDKNLNVPVNTSTTLGIIAGITLLGLGVWKIRQKPV